MLIPAVVCQYRQKRLSVKGLSCPCLEFLLKTYILYRPLMAPGTGFGEPARFPSAPKSFISSDLSITSFGVSVYLAQDVGVKAVSFSEGLETSTVGGIKK